MIRVLIRPPTSPSYTSLYFKGHMCMCSSVPAYCEAMLRAASYELQTAETIARVEQRRRKTKALMPCDLNRSVTQTD